MEEHEIKVPTPQEIESAKLKALDALRNKPSTYRVEVLNPQALPDKLKNRKEIVFTIKPPTMSVLTDIGLILQKLPQELFDPNDLSLTKEAIKNIPALVDIIAVLAHGPSKKPVPGWYAPFLSDNLTIQEVLQLWFECSQKLQTDFFFTLFPDCQASKSNDDEEPKRFNPFTMIGTAMNYFGLSYDEVFFETPYRTLVFLSASVPRYENKEKKEKPKHLFDILSTHTP